jgi:hypothetical protein
MFLEQKPGHCNRKHAFDLKTHQTRLPRCLLCTTAGARFSAANVVVWQKMHVTHITFLNLAGVMWFFGDVDYTGEWVRSQSLSAASIRVCQPAPAARKACTTSGDKRMVVDTLGGIGPIQGVG